MATSNADPILIRESFQQTEIFFLLGIKGGKAAPYSCRILLTFYFFVNFLCTAFSSVKKGTLKWYLKSTVGHYMEDTKGETSRR
jgi:hypothetical protein